MQTFSPLFAQMIMKRKKIGGYEGTQYAEEKHFLSRSIGFHSSTSQCAKPITIQLENQFDA